MSKLDNVRFGSEKCITEIGPVPTRRSFLTASAAAGSLGRIGLVATNFAAASEINRLPTNPSATVDGDSIRPFSVNLPADLHPSYQNIDPKLR